MSAIGLARHATSSRPCENGDDCAGGNTQVSHDLKKLFAASLEARFLAMAVCSRSISEVISAMRSANSSTDSSETSCPIS